MHYFDHKDPTPPIDSLPSEPHPPAPTLQQVVHGTLQRHGSSAPWGVPTHRGGDWTLLLITSGTATYQLARRSYQLQPGCLAWIPPYHQHSLISASPGLSLWLATFDEEVVVRLGQLLELRTLAELKTTGPVVCPLARSSTQRLESLMSDLQTHNEARMGVTSLGIVALCHLILSAWAEKGTRRGAEANCQADVHPAVEKAAQLLSAQGNQVTLEELAKICGASSAWLSRLFRHQMGQSLVDYRNQHRIERFFQLYRSGHRLNITQAALEAGFGSYAQFHRVFRKQVGYGPAELRRKLSMNR